MPPHFGDGTRENVLNGRGRIFKPPTTDLAHPHRRAVPVTVVPIEACLEPADDRRLSASELAHQSDRTSAGNEIRGESVSDASIPKQISVGGVLFRHPSLQGRPILRQFVQRDIASCRLRWQRRWCGCGEPVVERDENRRSPGVRKPFPDGRAEPIRAERVHVQVKNSHREQTRQTPQPKRWVGEEPPRTQVVEVGADERQLVFPSTTVTLPALSGHDSW